MTQREAAAGQYLVSPGGEAMKERLIKLWDGNYDAEGLSTMTPTELFDAWMDYEGIIGYTDTIIQMLRESGFVVEEVET